MKHKQYLYAKMAKKKHKYMERTEDIAESIYDMALGTYDETLITRCQINWTGCLVVGRAHIPSTHTHTNTFGSYFTWAVLKCLEEECWLWKTMIVVAKCDLGIPYRNWMKQNQKKKITIKNVERKKMAHVLLGQKFGFHWIAQTKQFFFYFQFFLYFSSSLVSNFIYIVVGHRNINSIM